MPVAFLLNRTVAARSLAVLMALMATTTGPLAVLTAHAASIKPLYGVRP